MASGATLSDRFTAATHKATGKAERTIRAAAQRSEHVAEWIRLAEKPAQLAQVSKGGRGKEGGLSKASCDLGIDRDDARRATKVAGLSDEAKQAAHEI